MTEGMTDTVTALKEALKKARDDCCRRTGCGTMHAYPVFTHEHKGLRR